MHRGSGRLAQALGTVLNGITHEEYVASVRSRIASIASSMLDGTLPFLEGVRVIRSLRGEVDLPADDPDLKIFLVVDSETDALPIGSVRELWADDALRRLEPEIESATRWAIETASHACESLVRRFGA